VAERVRVRDITSQEGNRLLRIVRRSSGSVCPGGGSRWCWVAAKPWTSPRSPGSASPAPTGSVICCTTCNLDGFSSLYPRCRGGRPPTFTLAQRRAVKQLALSRPQDHELPFSTWSLAKLAEFLAAEGWSTITCHEGLWVLLHQQGVSFQVTNTWKQSTDPDFDSPHLRPVTTRRSASGHRPTTPSWPMCPPMPPGSTASRPSAARCAPSPWTAPTTPATASRPA
jgi:hypothetical protein